MLTLGPGSVCDVCAEEYSPYRVPHSLPCGHVLSWGCCYKIVEKTLPRLQAACPFCPDHFTSDDMRSIRIGFSNSGRVTSRRRGRLSPSRREGRFPLIEPDVPHTRAETRRLEDKVARVATRKCSVEEVSTLHNELQDWLTHDEKSHNQPSSLSLCAALLRVILMSHIAHSEATRMAKGVEATLREKLDNMELNVSKLEANLRQQQTLYTQKVQECQALRAELGRYTLKSASAQAAASPPRSSTAAPTGLSERLQSVSSAAASTYNVPVVPSMLSRFAAIHSRSASASVSGGSRPTTPARTTAPSIRSETPTQLRTTNSSTHVHAPLQRNSTAGQSVTPTPGPEEGYPAMVVPKMLVHASSVAMQQEKERRERDRQREQECERMERERGRDLDPGSKSDSTSSLSVTDFCPILLSTSPIPPSRPRTISISATSPQKITRSHSDEQERERERIHERWMPSPNMAYIPPTGKTINYPPYFGSSPAPGRYRSSFSTNVAGSSSAK
ncbi:uncharacterized protein BJ212DRAFT_405350 [Suillus subaureus]|uniref:RING-type domain-containing protein n=1 Tax=Suillus subaureus TaxID=48587 RepID=A0A9P7E7V5_9AGAM|nr:uncharacterized protein BJ212DRAFT_405350 [Suillus subaureus]KAG1813685.1 hypothetical protein BJ212DRAFT_405350 [Suillus subaureus]